MTSSPDQDLDLGTPLPESEQEKQYKAILDAAADMFDDEDYRRYVWGFIISDDGGKTFKQVAGYRPPGTEWSIRPSQEIAPVSNVAIIEPTLYKAVGVLASEWKPDKHPISLLRTQNEENPSEAWEATPNNEQEMVYTLTFDLGEERVIGCVEFWPTKKGDYKIEIGTGVTGKDFRCELMQENFTNSGPPNDFLLGRLIRDRYIQIRTNCNAVKRVRILSMSQNATEQEKEQLSKEFYEEQTRAMRKQHRR
jgi:hypothetical protein